MNFKQAIEEMKKGKKVRRKGWGDTWFVINNYGTLLRCIPSFYNKNQADTNIDPLSLANVENIFAEDWEVVGEKKKLGEKKKWYKPEMCNDYYYIDWDGDIDSITYDNAPSDRMAINIGNCFKELEQARFIVEKLKVIHELEKFAFENNEEEIDWSDVNQDKLYLVMNFKNKSIDIFHTYGWIYIPFNVFFTSEEIARRAIETIGEDRIKKYYFGVEDE